MSDAATGTPAAPSPSLSPAEDAGPMLTCAGCRRTAYAGIVTCPACGRSTRTPAAAALAALAGLGALAALGVYGYELGGARGSALRPTFYFLSSLGTLLAAVSIFRGRRAGWLGLQFVWAAQVLVPLLYAAALHRDVARTLVAEPAIKLPFVLGLFLAYLAPTRAYCSAPSNLVAITRRELGAYLFSPVAYLIMTAFLFFLGLFFFWFMQRVSSVPLDEGLERVFGNVSWLLMFCAPLLTMGLLAEEKRSGTVEILMTAPVTDVEIVTAKFLGTMIFFGILIAPTLIYVAILAALSYSPPDYGAVAGNYVGLLFMAAVYFAIGLFISSLTSSQVVSAIVTFVVFFAVLVAGSFAENVTSEWLRAVLERVSFFRYYESFGRGIIDTRAVVYYMSLIALNLFLTVRSLESRRWA